MNMNEVLSNLANLRLGSAPGTKKPVHPNDHVNLGQSSNDVIPTAVHLSIAKQARVRLIPALSSLAAVLLDKADADILPVRIDGAQFTPLSRLKGKLRLRWFPKITLTVLEPLRFEVDPGLRGRERRQASGARLYDLMCELIFETCERERTLYEALTGRIVYEHVEGIDSTSSNEVLGYLVSLARTGEQLEISYEGGPPISKALTDVIESSSYVRASFVAAPSSTASIASVTASANSRSVVTLYVPDRSSPLDSIDSSSVEVVTENERETVRPAS